MTQSVIIVGKNEGWNLEGSYARAFKKLDWDVQFWDPYQALLDEARGGAFGRRFSSFVQVEPWARKANLAFLSRIEKMRPQLILVIATDGTRAGSLAQIKVMAPETFLVCLFPDGPHNLSTDRIACLPVFDLVLTSSPAWMQSFKTLGARVVRYLPFAADVELHQPVSRTPAAAGHDVAFIGNWRLEREEVLEQLSDFDLWLWGEKWWKERTREGSPLRTRWGGRRVTGAEFAAECVNNRILLNLLDTPTWPGPNMRAFEQPACRGFSLTTRTPAILDYFKEGENIECFDSIEEAREKIGFYLKNEDSRKRIADAAYDFVVKGANTYLDRARQIISWAREAGWQ